MTLARKPYEADCAIDDEMLTTVDSTASGIGAIGATAHMTKLLIAEVRRLRDVVATADAASDASVANARAEEYLDAMERVVSFRKGIEHGPTEELRAWRVLKALLVEAGRRVA